MGGAKFSISFVIWTGFLQVLFLFAKFYFIWCNLYYYLQDLFDCSFLNWLYISGVVSSKFLGGGGAKLEPIFPNQVKMIVEAEKWYHKGKDILKENWPVSLDTWIIQAHLSFDNIFLLKLNFSRRGGGEIKSGRNLCLEGSVALPLPPWQTTPLHS